MGIVAAFKAAWRHLSPKTLRNHTRVLSKLFNVASSVNNVLGVLSKVLNVAADFELIRGSPENSLDAR